METMNIIKKRKMNLNNKIEVPKEYKINKQHHKTTNKTISNNKLIKIEKLENTIQELERKLKV